MKTGSAKSLKFKPEKPLKPQVKLFKASALIRRKFLFIEFANVIVSCMAERFRSKNILQQESN
jgi:hypothetical protein